MKIESRAYLLMVAAVCLAMTLVFGGLIETVVRHNMYRENEIVRESLLSTGALLAQDIQQNVSNSLFVTDTLHALLESNAYVLKDFDEWGKLIFRSDATVSAVQLAPDGVVQCIYPLEGNEGAIGHDLLKDKKRDDGARKTVTSRETTLIGPVKLIQSGKYAVIARKPIFIGSDSDGEDKFWGFTIALVLVDDFLLDEIVGVEEQGVKIRLQGDDPDAAANPVFYESEGWIDGNAVSMKIKVPNGEWGLKISASMDGCRHYLWVRILGWALAVLVFGYIFSQQYRVQKNQLEIIKLNGQLRDELSERELSAKQKEQLILELQTALGDVKTLSGLLPICSKCKKIRDDDGYWNDLEAYFEEHSNLLFTHGMCKTCADSLYGDQEWYRKKHMKDKDEE